MIDGPVAGALEPRRDPRGHAVRISLNDGRTDTWQRHLCTFVIPKIGNYPGPISSRSCPI